MHCCESFFTRNGHVANLPEKDSNSDRSSWFLEVSLTIQIRFGLERTLTSVQFDKFSMHIILLYIPKFFLFFICASSHFIQNGILMHFSIEDLARNACEFNNRSNDQKHPAEPSISLLFIVLMLSLVMCRPGSAWKLWLSFQEPGLSKFQAKALSLRPPGLRHGSGLGCGFYVQKRE